VIALLAGVVLLVVLGYDIQSTPILVGATAAGQLCMFGIGYLYYKLPRPIRASRTSLSP
jgi:hypothetical protein